MVAERQPQGCSREVTAQRDRVYQGLHRVLYNHTLATLVLRQIAHHATLREPYPERHAPCGRTLVGLFQALYLSGGRQEGDGAHCDQLLGDQLLGAWLVTTPPLANHLYLLELLPTEGWDPQGSRPC